MYVSACIISLVIVSTILGSLVLVLLIGLFFYIRHRRKAAAKKKREQKVVDDVKQSKTPVAVVTAENKPIQPQPPIQEPAKAKDMSDERRAEEGAAGFATAAEIPKPKPKSVITTQPTQLDTFKKPENETMADAKDPNYRSMKGVENDIFNVPQKPARSASDQYEVLSNLQNIVPVAEAKTPAAGDQYESLADLNNQEIIETKAVYDKEKAEDKDKKGVSLKGEDKISKKEEGDKSPEKADDENVAALPDPLPSLPPPPLEQVKKKGPAFKRPEMGKVSSKNPQYETFAGVSDAIFLDGKKPE